MRNGADALDALSLDVDIGSREQVSRDQAARIRIQFLCEQCAILARQTHFADTKAAALLALAGVVGARVTMEAEAITLTALEGGMLALTAAVLLLCLLVLMPRYPGARLQAAIADRERFSWVSLSAPGQGPDAYAEFARSAEISQIIVSIARTNAAMAQVLHRKFRRLRLAFQLALADIALAALHHLDAETALAAWLAR